ncbi:MAG TPA: hypothetical protein DEZ08_06155 [Dehalococcoidia bacterium]|jgi:hypothetical protein|nr:hypothetical protein [Dehalococcoidia bacterium]|tara:strand:- start:2662 stop:2910 length:249 start_codon:yes stop_codon:yes gene_type:complete
MKSFFLIILLTVCLSCSVNQSKTNTSDILSNDSDEVTTQFNESDMIIDKIDDFSLMSATGQIVNKSEMMNEGPFFLFSTSEY